MAGDTVSLLVVDNDAEYRHSLLPLLELEGYEVVEAESVTDAKQKLRKGKFELALVDLRMIEHRNYADISGLEVAMSAREVGIPVIVMTAFESVETARLALRTRGGEPLAADYVLKRAGPTALLDAIRVVLGSAPQAAPPAAGKL